MYDQKIALAGDASTRRYERWTNSTTQDAAIYMDARDDRPGGIHDFCRISDHLRGLGLSAPKIYERSDSHLLLEDLGRDHYADTLLKHPELENSLYLAAADALGRVVLAPPLPDLPAYGPVEMANSVAPVFEFYGRGDVDGAPYIARLADMLAALPTRHNIMILRDFHAENLIWMRDRNGPARAGILDFQDAMIGHRAYDLCSLLQDARRDVAPTTVTQVIDRFCHAIGAEKEAFLLEYHAQALVRNLRILGVLARLIQMGKPKYLAFLPRVWHHLQTDIQHPVTAGFAPLLDQLPSPDATHLSYLRDLHA